MLGVNNTILRMKKKCFFKAAEFRHIKILTVSLVFLTLAKSAENPQVIYLESPYYAYIDYLINSGRLVPDFLLQQPYMIGDLDTLSFADAGEYYQKYRNTFYTSKLVSGQMILQDQCRNSAYEAINRIKATGSIHIGTPNVLFANRIIFDQNYKHDPKYAGDLSESDHWLYGRVNDAYMQLSYHNIGLFVGRMQRNWGPINELGLILSSQPYTYDHFVFNYQYHNIRFSLLFARLEDMQAQERESKTDTLITTIENARKYLVGHRFDFMFSNNFQIALSEMATYGGEGRDFEFAFINPMNFYYGIQRNDQKQMNGFWALDLFYKPLKKLSLYGQVLIDDFIVNNEPGIDDRGQYPDRLALLLSARTGDFIVPGLNTNLTYVRIWNRTYQSIRTYENFHFRELGLGYACASCEEIKIKFSYWNLFPWIFKNEFILGRYGDVKLTDLFLLNKEKFPVAPVTNNIVNQFIIYYYPHTRLSLWMEWLYIKERNHYLNRIDPFDGLAMKLGIQIMLSGGFNL
jgi:hypothetical protein